MPSLTALSYVLDISRDTADKVYGRLRKMGIVRSIPGKGNFISSVSVIPPLKIFLLFNKISEYNKFIYDSFVSLVGAKATIDFFIYNNDISLFKKILKERKKEYSRYVIIPPVMGLDEDVVELLSDIPSDKLLLLNGLTPGFADSSAVYEDFERDIFLALEEALPRLINYHTLKIIFPEHCFFSGQYT